MAPCVSLEPELMTMIVSMSVFARRGREMVGKPKPKESYDPFFSVNSIQKKSSFRQEISDCSSSLATEASLAAVLLRASSPVPYTTTARPRSPATCWAPDKL